MVFPLCFASLTTCKCQPSCVLIKCQNVIAVERLMHCVTMMMPATAVVVTAGLAWFSRLAPSLGCSALLQPRPPAAVPPAAAAAHHLLLSSHNILTVSTLRQGPVAAESRRLGAILPEFRRSPEFSLSQSQAVPLSGVDANGIQVTGRPGNS